MSAPTTKRVKVGDLEPSTLHAINRQADHVIKALGCHDDLVAACRLVLERQRAERGLDGRRTKHGYILDEGALFALRAVLKKAETM